MSSTSILSWPSTVLAMLKKAGRGEAAPMDTMRRQVVRVASITSSPTIVCSGVPQGSVLGHQLLLVTVSGTDECVTSSFLSSFADDSLIGKEVETVENVQGPQYLNPVCTFATTKNMAFNSLSLR